MKKLLKYAAFGFGGIILLVLLVMAYFAATFNPNDYKQQVIDIVKEKNQRNLTIDGDITLSFWPKLGANLGKVSISEHQSDKEFASINSAKVALAVLPLLKSSLVVDTIYIDGAKANIVKYKDGTTNYDDLLSKDESESSEIKFDVQGINISNSAVTYQDESTEAEYNISEFNMTSGHIALAEPVDLEVDFTIKANQPVVAAKTKLKGNFLFDPETKHFKVKGLDSHTEGDMLGGKNMDITASGDIDAQTETMEFLVDNLKFIASGNFNGTQQSVDLNAPSINIQKDEISSKKVTVSVAQKNADTDLKVNMVLADMTGSPKALQSKGITGDISMVQGKRTVKGNFSSPFSGDIENLIFDIPKLVGQLDVKDPSLPNGAMKGTFNLSAHTDIKKELTNSKFNLVMADTKLNGDVAVASFKTPNIKFNLNADKIDLNKLLPKSSAPSKASGKPADMSALKTLLLNGKVNIGSIIYDKHTISGLKLGIKADGKKLNISGLNLKVNDSHIKGRVGISNFAKPLYTFDVDIDKLNLDKYISKTDDAADAGDTSNTVIDLSALKALNADGSLRIGHLTYGKTKASNVRIDLKANGGVATLSPFKANLYKGSMNGLIKVDARSTPNIAFKQTLTNVSIGPLMTDAINNDMLSGTGTIKIDVSTQGNTVGELKKKLAGSSSLALVDGALKGIDIAGGIRGFTNKLNVLKAKEVDADKSKKTDFSELTATFAIKNGVAHNEDLAMKAPILRLTKGDSRGDINIANETINYTAKPTIVKSLKGQGGKNMDKLNGISIPVKISGTFSNPKYGVDYAAVATGLAKSKLLDKVGGEKGAAVQELLNGDNKIDALKDLFGKKKSKKKSKKEAAPAKEDSTATKAEDKPKPAKKKSKDKKPKSAEDKAKDSLKDLLKF